RRPARSRKSRPSCPPLPDVDAAAPFKSVQLCASSASAQAANPCHLVRRTRLSYARLQADGRAGDQALNITDLQGNTLSGAGGDSLVHYETALHGLRCFIGDPVGEAEAAIRLDPDFVMAHVFKGYVYALSTEASAMPVAKACFEAAAALPATARE